MNKFEWDINGTTTPSVKVLFEWHNALAGVSPMHQCHIRGIRHNAKNGTVLCTVIAELSPGVKLVGYSDNQNRYVGHEYISNSDYTNIVS